MHTMLKGGTTIQALSPRPTIYCRQLPHALEIPRGDERTLTIILILISIPTVNEFNG